MGYLYGMAKLGEAGVDLYKGIRGEVEQSRFKDFINENPDWADDPDKMSKAIGISPQLGMELVNRGETVAKQRQARAASRLLFLQDADDAAHTAWTKALNTGAAKEDAAGGMGAPGDVMRGEEANYAAADKAGNDAFQRWRLQAQELYGAGFADKLPQVWKLDEYGERKPRYERMIDSMREPVNVIFPDGAATTAALLPRDQARLAKANPGIRFTKIGTGADVPGATRQLSPEEAEKRGLPATGRYQMDAKGGVSTVVDPEKVAQMTNELGDRYVRESSAFDSLQQDYGVVRSAARAGTRAGDMTLLTKYAKMHNPGRSLGEGGYLSAQEAVQALPPWLASVYNALLEGKPTPLTNTTRQELLDEAHEMYINELGPQQQRIATYENQAKERSLPTRDVLGRVVMRDKDLADRLVLPKEKEGAKGPAKAEDATVTVGSPKSNKGTVTLGGQQFEIKAQPKKRTPTL